MDCTTLSSPLTTPPIIFVSCVEREREREKKVEKERETERIWN